MRASDRDRERAVALLQARCAEGYLSVETFEHRLDGALRARTAAELRALVADLARMGRPWLRALRRLRPTRAAPVALPVTGAIVVGRSRGCDVVVADPTVRAATSSCARSTAPGWRSTWARATGRGCSAAGSGARGSRPATSSCSARRRSASARRDGPGVGTGVAPEPANHGQGEVAPATARPGAEARHRRRSSASPIGVRE